MTDFESPQKKDETILELVKRQSEILCHFHAELAVVIAGNKPPMGEQTKRDALPNLLCQIIEELGENNELICEIQNLVNTQIISKIK